MTTLLCPIKEELHAPAAETDSQIPSPVRFAAGEPPVQTVKYRISLSLLALAVIAAPASAALIDFDTLTGPSTFAAAGPAQTIPFLNVDGTGVDVTFTGGVILDNTANLPANQTPLYGTANFAGPTLQNPLTVTFSSPVSNFFLDVYNGLTTPIAYEVADNAGNFATFTLAPNLSSGTTLIGFPATGSIVTIASVTPPVSSWDFFIDNIHFNEPLPPGLAPEPGTMLLLGAGLAAAIAANRRRKQN